MSLCAFKEFASGIVDGVQQAATVLFFGTGLALSGGFVLLLTAHQFGLL